MRVSVRKDDPGYKNYRIDMIPYLDGKKLKNCITADEEKGYALCFKTDYEDNFIVNKAADEVETIELYGKVVIKNIKES